MNADEDANAHASANAHENEIKTEKHLANAVVYVVAFPSAPFANEYAYCNAKACIHMCVHESIRMRMRMRMRTVVWMRMCICVCE
jgi:hypothetical protein